MFCNFKTVALYLKIITTLLLTQPFGDIKFALKVLQSKKVVLVIFEMFYFVNTVVVPCILLKRGIVHQF